MLHEVALSQKSTKKRVFIGLAKILGLWKGITWHATSEEEVNRIRKIVSNQAKIKLLSNVPHINPRLSIPAWSHKQDWLLVARMSPEKGVLESIQWLSTHSIADRVTLHVVGPIENKDYYRSCADWVARHPTLNVIFHDALPFEEIIALKEKCHVFYLATKGENFGHAIAEALLSGMPVIISDRTPWKELREANVGWVSKWNESAFHAVFDEWNGVDEKDYLKIMADLEVYREKWKSHFLDAVDWEELFSF
jgi:glycosyltransferase involved in cell wall biosynthesis